ncbi:hypothetical protein FF1_036572 [Malus domestica]
MLGKQHRDSFPSLSTWKAKDPLELIHIDICGPMQVESHSGNKYFLLFTNDYTRMSWVYFLRNKSDAFKCFKKFKVMTELQCGYKVKCLRSDREGEFLSAEFDRYCNGQGIQRQLTMAYTPPQNGVFKRKNRTVVDMAKSMLHEKNLPYAFWVEAVNTAVYLINRCPTKALKKSTPFEAYSGRKPGITHLKIFGSLCYVHIPSNLRHKLQENSHKCIFVGYGTSEKGYRLFDPISRKIILSRDVTFDESASWNWKLHYRCTTDSEVKFPVITELKSSNEAYEIGESSHFEENNGSQIEGVSDRSQIYDDTAKKWRSISEIMAQCNMCIIEPESYDDVAKDDSWRNAMRAELDMIEKNNTLLPLWQGWTPLEL